MKVLRVLTTLGSLLLAGGGLIMMIGNPGPQDYETYATDALSRYLKEQICPQAANNLGGLIQSYCKTLVDTGRPQIHHLITYSTTRKNYLIFSIYATELSLPSPVPTYKFQTIGVMQQFYTYEAEKL
jgi:hypothetical protein